MPKIVKDRSKIDNVELKSLLIDHSYQRALKKHHRHIRDTFNPNAANVLYVGKRANGEMYVIDGQQRREAMIALGYTHWKAIIVPSSGPREEAVLFDILNGRKGRQGLTAQELFRSLLIKEDPYALAVKRAVEGAGLQLQLSGPTKKYPQIAYVGSLLREVAINGEAVILSAFKDIATAWPEQDEAMKDVIGISLIRLYGRLGDKIDRTRMVNAMSRHSPRAVILDSMSGVAHRLVKCMDAFIAMYNKRLSSKARLRLVNEDVA